MQRFALIVDGFVHEIVELPEDASLSDRYHQSLTFLAAGQDVCVGWRLVDGVLTPPPTAPAPDLSALVAYAAELRWRREVGGIVANGIPVATDDRSKVMILGARLAALGNPGWTTLWHGTDGESHAIDATAILAISVAVEAHVNAAFARFAEVKAEIEAGALTTTAQVEAAMAA